MVPACWGSAHERGRGAARAAAQRRLTLPLLDGSAAFHAEGGAGAAAAALPLLDWALTS